MKSICWLGLVAISTTVSFGAAPVVTAVLNNYSYTLPESPNYGIAQGSIFVIFGSDLANTTSALQSAPLPTSVSGVHVGLGADGEQNSVALLYYVSPTQIVGVLPSTWPVGTSFLWVRNNNEQSFPVPFNVVRSAFGILTRDASGFGPASAFDERANALSSANFSRPGGVISIYGSGVGPIATGDGFVPPQTNLTNIPMTAEIGGMEAEILYRGRTIYPGLDQINVRVPNLRAETFGCSVPLVIKSNGISSNTAMIPVGEQTACPAPLSSGNTDTTMAPAELERLLAAGSFTVGEIWISSGIQYWGYFYRALGVARNTEMTPEAGRCVANSGGPSSSAFTYRNWSDLYAGPFIHASGPSGTMVARWEHDGHGSFGYYSDDAVNPRVTTGRYILSGPGGTDIGAFSGTLDLGPEFIWTNPDDAKVVTRADALTIRWAGGDPKELVHISGSHANNSGGPSYFHCAVRNATGQFTVPASILNQLRAGDGSISIYSSTSTRLQATGVDYFTARYSWSYSGPASFR